MGGTNEQDNLIELTIEEHAEAHKVLFEEYGNWQDYLAWKGLSGQISKDEILIEIYKQNGKKLGLSNKGKSAWNKGLTKDDPRVLKYCTPIGYKIKNTINMGRYERTDEIKLKMSKEKTKEHIIKIKEKAISQWANNENRLAQSKRCKENRDVCPYCGMESNKSNITRHKKKCGS